MVDRPKLNDIYWDLRVVASPAFPNMFIRWFTIGQTGMASAFTSPSVGVPPIYAIHGAHHSSHRVIATQFVNELHQCTIWVRVASYQREPDRRNFASVANPSPFRVTICIAMSPSTYRSRLSALCIARPKSSTSSSVLYAANDARAVAGTPKRHHRLSAMVSGTYCHCPIGRRVPRSRG